MPLISCIECNGPVSALGLACPHCGAPVKLSMPQEATEIPASQPPPLSACLATDGSVQAMPASSRSRRLVATQREAGRKRRFGRRDAFRLLILFTIIVGVGQVAASALAPSILPEPLKSFVLNSSGEQSPVSLMLPICILITAFVAVSGLFLFWSPARHIFLGLCVCCLFSQLLSGPAVDSALSVVLDQIGTFLEGGIVAVTYFSPLREEFKGKTGEELV